ncbi:MAG: hypothetical protein IPM79_10965 [Polyangiaceae bacterium]|nr:hypothetical protein [Polyangiaceae bacterium]
MSLGMFRPPRLRRAAAAGVAAAVALIGLPQEAQAEVKVGVEVRGELMRRFNVQPYGGPSVAVDLGYSFDTYPIMVIPELTLVGAFYAPEIYTGSFRALGGLRVGAALEVEPTIYVRGGYLGIFGRDVPDHGGVFEAGAAIDKRLERSLTIGGSLGYQGFFAPRWAHGMAAGFHVGFWL